MPAEAALILTPSELHNIRRYVKYKYAALPHEKHAEIVADAVQRIIMKQLPEFELSMKLKLTKELVVHTVLREQRPLQASDIFHHCVPHVAMDELPMEPMLSWVNHTLSCELTEQQLRQLIRDSSGSYEQLWNELHQRATLSPGQATPITPLFPAPKKPGRPYYLIIAFAVTLLVAVAAYAMKPPAVPTHGAALQHSQSVAELLSSSFPMLPSILDTLQLQNDLTPGYQYALVNLTKLRAYLNDKDSLLADPPYFDTILDTAKRYNIHPLLLFAIAGQEQGFVPRSHKDAELIANNPFNVFHSWKLYNTTIEDSADIAARTVLRWSKDRPDGVDAVEWVNRKYAEDPDWHKGVLSLFLSMLH